MKTMMPTRRALLSALNRCIEATRNAEMGFATAAADGRDPELRKVFEQRSRERAAYARGLQRAVSELGGRPENRGTLEGALHRAWIETRLVVEGCSDATVLVECERGERAALAIYDVLLLRAGTDHTLPYSLRAMIAKQHAEVGTSLADISRRLAERT